MFTSKCVFRHSGVQCFDIWTSKSAPSTSCFARFHFQMCFSPQRRAMFRHLNFKKCSEHLMFCTFSLPNVLHATAACIFSTSDLRNVLRTRQFFNIFTSKCAFRHTGVQFLISPLTTWHRTRRFNRPTFRLTRHTNHWKNTAFRDFSNIYRGCIFFLLTFALVYLLPSDLTAFLICFSTVHIVGSLLFKLPSIKMDDLGGNGGYIYPYFLGKHPYLRKRWPTADLGWFICPRTNLQGPAAAWSLNKMGAAAPMFC